MATPILSRAEAKAKGLKRYFTNKPCKHGHIAERSTANGVCVVCAYEIEKRYKAAHPEKRKEKWRTEAARHRRDNPERIRKNRKNWELKNPDNVKLRKKRYNNTEKGKATVLARARAARAADPEKFSKKNREYKTLHAARLSPLNIARVKQWRKDNPERALALSAKVVRDRWARIKEVGGKPYTVDEVNRLLELQSWKCINCNASLKKDRELDHRMPVALRDPNEIANFEWLCPPCNRKKGAKDPIDWARENGRLL